MEKHYLTPEGKIQLEEKLNFYKTVKRPNVVKRIGIAREFGDFVQSEFEFPKDYASRHFQVLDTSILLSLHPFHSLAQP